jgi:hypothetical protein
MAAVEEEDIELDPVYNSEIKKIDLTEPLDINKVKKFVTNVAKKYGIDTHPWRSFSSSDTQLYFISNEMFFGLDGVRNFQHFSTYKIHLMVKLSYFKIVYDTLFKNIDKFGTSYDDEKPLLYFKLMQIKELSVSPTSNYGLGFLPTPYPNVTLTDLIDFSTSDVNHIRLHPRTYTRTDGETYHNELLFSPVFVFYVCSGKIDEMKNLSTLLMQLFPEIPENKEMEVHYYPRFNFKLNSLLYFSIGDSIEKINQCDENQYKIKKYKEGKSGKQYQYVIPSEYYEKQATCARHDNEKDCNNSNGFSKEFSNHTLCTWQTDKCVKNPIYSPHLLTIMDFTGDYETDILSIKKIYNEIGHPEIYDTLLEESRKHLQGKRTKRTHDKKRDKKILTRSVSKRYKKIKNKK